MRTQHEICDAISRMDPAEQGRLIERIRAMPGWSDERKETTIKFVMLLGLIEDRCQKMRS